MSRKRNLITCPYFGNYLKFAYFFIINLNINHCINMPSSSTSLDINENQKNVGIKEFLINYDNDIVHNKIKINDVIIRSKRNSLKSAQSSLSKLVEVGMVRENNNFGSTFLNTCPEKCSCLGDYYECKNLKELPSFPSWIRELDLSGNKLEDSIGISDNNLNQLIVLSLKRNRLRKIPVFKELFSLEELILSNNKIQAITAEAILALPNLRVLDLSRNEISIILPNSFPVKNQLEQLNLNGNKIVSLEENSFSTLTYLNDLQLNRNGLQTLPTEIFKNLRNLKKLYLNDNKVNITYSMFKGLDKLKIIKLKSNNLSQLSDGVFYNLKFIESIELDSNYIQILGRQGFYNLSTLTSLNLSNNSITTLNADTFEFTQDLIFLDLSKNQLSEIKSQHFNCLKKLQQLNLSYNNLRFINELAFQCISKLEILDLSHNKLSSVTENKNGVFKQLKNLKILNLNTNNIKVLNQKTFIGLQNLQELNLIGNNITTIQYDSFDALQNLNKLQINSDQFLCDCNIQYIYKWLKNNINKLLQNNSKIEIKCQYPSYLKGKTLLNLKTNQLICNESTKPRIIKEPSTQVIGKGKNVTFECAATSMEKNSMEIVWRKDNLDLQLNQSEIEKKTAFENNMTIIISYLYLTNASHSQHSGRYQCVAKNNYGTIYSQKFKVTVSSFPSFVKVPHNITIKSGDTARLECKALGDPKPQISWQKDGGNEFPAARERRMHVIQAEDTFFIVNAKLLDMGVYTCTADNPAGIISVNATLIVNEAPLLLQDASIFKEVILGHSFVVECLCTGTPKPKLLWYKDNKLIESTNRHFYSASKQLLIITSSKSNDTGIYKCEIRNELGVKYGYNNIIIKKRNSNNVINIEEMIGIIIITVFCCAIGTSIIWVVIIYQTKKPTHINSIQINENSTPSNNHLHSNYNNSNTSNHSNNNNNSNTSNHNNNTSDSIISININPFVITTQNYSINDDIDKNSEEFSLFPQDRNLEQSTISNHIEYKSRLSDVSGIGDHSSVYDHQSINPFIHQQQESEFSLQNSPQNSKINNGISFDIVGIPLNDNKKNLYLTYHESIPLSGLDIDSLYYRKNNLKNNSKHLLTNSLLKNPSQLYRLSKSHETIFNCNNSLENLTAIAFNVIQKKSDSMSKDSGTGTYETITSYGKSKFDCANKRTNNLNNSLNSDISELSKSDSLEMELNSSTTQLNYNTRRKSINPLNKIIYNDSLTNQLNNHNNLSIINYPNNCINDDLIHDFYLENYVENNSENFINCNNNYNSKKNINSCDKKIKPPPLPVKKHKNRNFNQKEKSHILLDNKKLNDVSINDIKEISSYDNKNNEEVPTFSEKKLILIDTVHENTKDNDIQNTTSRFNRLKERKSKINSQNNCNNNKDSIINHSNINSCSIQSLELINETNSFKLNNNKSSNNSNDIVYNYSTDHDNSEYDINCHNIRNLDIHGGCIKNEDGSDNDDDDGSNNMNDKSLLYFQKNNDKINLVNTSLVPLIQTNNKHKIRKNNDNHNNNISSNSRRNSSNSNNKNNKFKNSTKNKILYNTVTIPVLATSSLLLPSTSPPLQTSVSISSVTPPSLPVVDFETVSK